MELFDDIIDGAPDKPLSLSELNTMIGWAVNRAFPETVWLCAETSDLRVNASSGHCYLEFIEKDEHSGQTVARARATIWARTFNQLKARFENVAQQSLVSGLKVLVNVSVEFHKLYGFSLTVNDIDPSYTLGDAVRRRREIVRRLQDEGVFDLNRTTPFPGLPQRIAVITSPTAAGYEDFISQLSHNEAGYRFYVKLFPAIMQGAATEESVIAALDRVGERADLFDVAVIIRGGGSAADLNCFDSYPLAARCAQFPLPIITGIGHERDDSVVDMVAHTRMKTPTAVAAFLIAKVDEQASELKTIASRLPASVARLIERLQSQLALTGSRLHTGAASFIARKGRELDLAEQFLTLASPQYILSRGYSLTLRDGAIIKRAAELAAGDEITIRYADGERQATIAGI